MVDHGTGGDAASPRPQGRDQVVEAVVRAATALYAERGPAAVTLRDIADAADVNVGLIHRHIGTKDQLVAAVLRHRPKVIAELEELQATVTLTEFLHAAFSVPFDAEGIVRLQAQAILDGYDLHALDVRIPTLEYLADELRRDLPEEVARLRAAALLAFIGGWRLFGQTYLTSLELEHLSPAELADALTPLTDPITTTPVRAEPS